MISGEFIFYSIKYVCCSLKVCANNKQQLKQKELTYQFKIWLPRQQGRQMFVFFITYLTGVKIFWVFLYPFSVYLSANSLWKSIGGSAKDESIGTKSLQLKGRDYSLFTTHRSWEESFWVRNLAPFPVQYALIWEISQKLLSKKLLLGSSLNLPYRETHPSVKQGYSSWKCCLITSLIISVRD